VLVVMGATTGATDGRAFDSAVSGLRSSVF
jgi:hypothetical protein